MCILQTQNVILVTGHKHDKWPLWAAMHKAKLFFYLYPLPKGLEV